MTTLKADMRLSPGSQNTKIYHFCSREENLRAEVWDFEPF